MSHASSEPALSFRADLGLWEVRDPALVKTLLADARLAVRPPAQQTPAHLLGRPLGQAFGRWLRMRDDPGHAPAKARLLVALGGLDGHHAGAASAQAALAFSAGWNHGLWASSACSIAALLGMACADLAAQQALLARLRSIALALAPAATPEQLDAADAACRDLMTTLNRTPSHPLGLAADDEAANRLALVWQSYEAGAALIGQGLMALAREPARRRPGSIAAWLPELQKKPGVVLNTRRFARVAMSIGDAVELQPGDGLLLQLSGSAGDSEDQALGFGHGAHACPGRQLALDIAALALEQLIASGREDWPAEWQMKILPNMQIPVFPENG